MERRGRGRREGNKGVDLSAERAHFNQTLLGHIKGVKRACFIHLKVGQLPSDNLTREVNSELCGLFCPTPKSDYSVRINPEIQKRK